MGREGASSAPIGRSPAMLAQLAMHPLLVQLGGNPGRVRSASQRVTPDLRSLFDLCERSSSLATASGIRSPEHGCSLVQDMSTDLDADTDLLRPMSVDETPEGTPLRAMSVDET